MEPFELKNKRVEVCVEPTNYPTPPADLFPDIYLVVPNMPGYDESARLSLSLDDVYKVACCQPTAGLRTFPLWKYEHGGILFTTYELASGFDQGRVGAVVCDDKAYENDAAAAADVNAYIETLNAWANGDIWDIVVSVVVDVVYTDSVGRERLAGVGSVVYEQSCEYVGVDNATIEATGLAEWATEKLDLPWSGEVKKAY